MAYSYPSSNNQIVVSEQFLNEVMTDKNFVRGQLAIQGKEIQKIHMELAAERKSIVQEYIDTTKDGNIVLHTIYSNKTAKCEKFITNRDGPVEMTRIEIRNVDESYYLLVFNKTEFLVFSEKVKARELKDIFLRKGIRFNFQFKPRKIEELLLSWISELMNLCTCTIKLTGLAGWNDGKFATSESIHFLEGYRKYIDIPLFQKSFDKQKASIALPKLEEYQNKLMKISDERIRLIFGLIPFAGITCSLIRTYNYSIPVINFVFTADDINPYFVSNYLQIFGREHMHQIDMSLSEKQIRKELNASKDEIFIGYGFVDKDNKTYSNEKIQKHMLMVARSALNKPGAGFADIVPKSVFVFCTNQILRIKGAMNVYIEKFTDSIDARDSMDSLEAIWAMFIQYVECYMDHVMKILEENADTGGEGFWKMLIKLVDSFWKLTNHTLFEILNLPEDFHVSYLWEEECEPEDLYRTFILAVRKSVPNIVAQPKKTAKAEILTLVYDDKFLWFSAPLLEDILNNTGISSWKYQILQLFKNAGVLHTDPYSEGYTRRLQIGGERKEYYMFDRNAFNENGKAEVITLARRRE